jgi:UDP-glucose 4-epimerase
VNAKKTILVTGGAGFIGSRLCERLRQGGHRVISLDNYFAGSRENHIAGVEYREGHTKDIARHIPEKIDLIYHLGEYARVEQSLLERDVVYDLNFRGTEGVIEFWKKRRCKLIYAGSSSKFSIDSTKYSTPYIHTKSHNSKVIKQTGDAGNLPYAIAYFYNVYGQGERAGIYGTVIEAFKRMYLSGAPLAVTSPGTQKRNFTHVEDIVDGLLLLGENGRGDEYGLGNEQSFTILDVAQLFGGDIVMLPPRAGNRMESGLDVRKSRELGWAPVRSLEEYVREFTRAHPRGTPRERRVLVFSTTFYPVMGPAEQTLMTLMWEMSDIEFDIVTAKFTREEPDESALPKNVHIYRVGFGNPLDKYLLPLLGFLKGNELHRKHRYLFAWSLMASYAALAGTLLKRAARLPLLVTLADQKLSHLSGMARTFFRLILSDADQVYGMSSSQEGHAATIAKRTLSRNALGDGDAFANQLRYAYAETLLGEEKPAKKKILIFSLAYYPHVGGAEVAIKEITDRIAPSDVEFHLITLRFELESPKEEMLGNIHVHRVGSGSSYLSKILFIPRAALEAMRLHRKLHFDAAWTMMSYMVFPIALMRFLGTRINYVLTLQDGDPFEQVFGRWYIWPLLPILRYGFRHASAVSVLSIYLTAWAHRMGYQGRAVVVPNGADTARFSREYPESQVNAIKDKLGKGMGDVWLITTSRLVQKNGLDDVIRALPLLPENVKFLILGTGPDEWKLKLLTLNSKLGTRVQFLGHIDHAELPLYLKASDVFIRPSRTEAFGASFAEAMAAGLPVVATQEGGLSDFIFDEKRNPDKPITAWAVDRDSPKQIAEAVKDIMSHPEKVRAVTATAKAMVIKKYDWNLIAKSMREKVFRKVLGER